MKEIQDPKFKWLKNLNLKSSPGSAISGIQKINQRIYFISEYKIECDYQNLVSLILGSHHANFMTPSYKSQVEKTVKRIGMMDM